VPALAFALGRNPEPSLIRIFVPIWVWAQGSLELKRIRVPALAFAQARNPEPNLKL